MKTDSNTVQTDRRGIRRTLMQRATDWYFGYDFFISYRQEDRSEYAEALYSELSKQYAVFIDAERLAVGDNWRYGIRLAVRNTRHLIVLVSAAAVRDPKNRKPEDDPIHREIREFRKSGRSIIRIDFNEISEDYWQNSPLSSHFHEADLYQLEGNRTHPSDSTLGRLHQKIGIATQGKKRTRWLKRAVLLLLTLLTASIVFGLLWRSQISIAEGRLKSSYLSQMQVSNLNMRDSTRAAHYAARAASLAPEEAESLYLATQAAGGQVKLVAVFEHENLVSGVQFTEDASKLFTYSYDGSACCWDIGSRRLLTKFDHHAELDRSVASPDGSRFVSFTVNEPAKLWDVWSKRVLQTFPEFSNINDFTSMFSTDGGIAYLFSQRQCVFCDAQNGEVTKIVDDVFAKPQYPSNKESFFLSGNETVGFTVWDANSGLEVCRLPIGKSEALTEALAAEAEPSCEMTQSADKSHILLWCNSSAALWKLASQQLVHEIVLEDRIYGAHIDDCGTNVTIWGLDHITVFDVTGTQPDLLKTVQADYTDQQILWPTWHRHFNSRTQVLKNLTQKASLNVQSENESVLCNGPGGIIECVCREHTPKVVTVRQAKSHLEFGELRHDRNILEVRLSSDGKFIATAGEDGNARVWAIEPTGLVGPDRSRAQHLAYHRPSGRLGWVWNQRSRELEAIGNRPPSASDHKMTSNQAKVLVDFADEASIYSAATGELIKRISLAEEDSSWILDSVITPDGEYAALLCSNESFLWNTADSSLLKIPRSARATGWKFDKSAKALFSRYSDGTIQRWNVNPLELSFEVQHRADELPDMRDSDFPPDRHYACTGFELSVDESALLTWSNDCTARILSPEDGTCRISLKHPELVTMAEWDSECKRIVTVCEETVRVFDATSGKEIWRKSFPEPVNHASFTGLSDALLVQSGPSCSIWDWRVGNVLCKVKHPGTESRSKVTFVSSSLSCDESLLLTSGGDATVFWDVTSGKCVSEISSKWGPRGAYFLPGQMTAYIWGFDYFIRWEMPISNLPAEHWETEVQVRTGTVSDDFGRIRVLNRIEWQSKVEHLMRLTTQ